MRQIRFNTFETNSSSTHSIAIFTEDDYGKWINRDGYVNWKNEFVSEEEALRMYEEYKSTENSLEFEDWINSWDSDLWDFDHWNEDLEQDHTTYTTKSGETIHIRCAYGYD